MKIRLDMLEEENSLLRDFAYNIDPVSKVMH